MVHLVRSRASELSEVGQIVTKKIIFVQGHSLYSYTRCLFSNVYYPSQKHQTNQSHKITELKSWEGSQKL